MTPPFWLPVLSSDIRKFPVANGTRRSRRPSTRPSSAPSGEELASSSTAVSTAETFPSSTRNGRLPHRNRSVKYASGTHGERQKSEMLQIQQKRYWSEYDNPEDTGSEGGYYLYINPEDDDSWIPFKDTATSIYSWFKKLFSKSNELNAEDPESQALLQSNRLVKDTLYESTVEEVTSATSSDSESSDSDIFRPCTTNYGTLPVSQPLVTQSMDRDRFGTLLASMISLFFSTTLSIVLLVLSAVGRKRARGEVDVVLLTGLFISLAFSIGGLWGVLKTGAGAVGIVVGFTVFTFVVIVDGLLAGKLIREI